MKGKNEFQKQIKRIIKKKYAVAGTTSCNHTS